MIYIFKNNFSKAKDAIYFEDNRNAKMTITDNDINWDAGNWNTQTNQQNLQLSFRNILGQNIAMFDIDEEHTELNVSSLQNGIYYVSLLQNGEQQFIQKLALIK